MRITYRNSEPSTTDWADVLFYQGKTELSDRKVGETFAGIHVSGPNAPKTAVCILRGNFADGLLVERLYERIGSSGRMFSDERVVEILQREGPCAEVLVDCPLTVPPCVACERPVCPGVMACEDVGVAYMLALAGKIPKERRRPVNPQTQRLWDVLRHVEKDQEHSEPTFSANMAPLVIRARTLQRRLNSLSPPLQLKETSIQHSLKAVAAALGWPVESVTSYRNFEEGRRTRENIVSGLQKAGWVKDIPDFDVYEKICISVENFQAFISGFVAAMVHCGKCEMTPKHAVSPEGFVCIPQFG